MRSSWRLGNIRLKRTILRERYLAPRTAAVKTPMRLQFARRPTQNPSKNSLFLYCTLACGCNRLAISCKRGPRLITSIVGEKVRREKALDFSGCNRPRTGSFHPIETAAEATRAGHNVSKR